MIQRSRKGSPRRATEKNQKKKIERQGNHGDEIEPNLGDSE